MMDPELMKMAQEQISRMSPSELAKIQQQMMANPELMRMASESMKNMRPEDLRNAAEQLKYARPEEMEDIGKKMANATPEEIAAMRARADSQLTYELNSALMLKNQGNEFHNKGRYNDALPKYLHAKKNLKGIPSSQSRTLQLACSLNVMSCYLKTKQYEECIKEGSEVLSYEPKNVKALYRRGQAFKEIGKLENAVADLRKAHEVSPDDETILEVLRDIEDKLEKDGGEHRLRGVVIEEITEEEHIVSSENWESSTKDFSVNEPQETSGSSKGQSEIHAGPTTNLDYLQALQDDPDSIRTFQNFISSTDPSTLAALSGGKTGEIEPDMVKTASNMISKMSPEELQNMLRLASSFQGGNPFLTGSSLDKNNPIPPNMNPDMLKTASDFMSKMPAEELQKMFEMASSLRGKNADSTPSNLHSTNRLNSDSRDNSAVLDENNSSRNSFSNLRCTESSFPTSTADLQEQMRNQMKDPAMRQMFTSMMKNISPDMMANMSEQFGVKLSPEDAEKAQQAMSSLSPETLDKMMLWVDRIQRGVECARKTKNWLLGRRGMILAICMLILAMILHRLGYIGS